MRTHNALVLGLTFIVAVPASWAWCDEGRDAERGFRRTAAVHTGSPWERNKSNASMEYSEGVMLFEQGQYEQASICFRRAAVADPELPHLANYMLRAEHEIEREEALKIGAAKEAEANNLLVKARQDIDAGRYEEGQEKLLSVLMLEPRNVGVLELIGQTKGALLTKAVPKIQNPEEAQKHYEAGLIAYAKNELSEAKKEWIITCSLDKDHPKAARALKRVQEEIAIEGESKNKGKNL